VQHLFGILDVLVQGWQRQQD